MSDKQPAPLPKSQPPTNYRKFRGQTERNLMVGALIIFFIVGGMKISITMIIASLGLFAALFAVKIIAKFIGVYFLAKKYIPSGGSMYTTLLMSTGLTFGTISSLFGLQAGIINQVQYSILVGVVVASAIIPTFIAQKWFLPVEEEDILDFEKK